MTFVYIVRCNFNAPDREQAWNDWYSGPKIVQMLRNPYFLTCQRFHRVAGDGRDYLALWTIEKPEAMTTPQYRSQWGFSEWTPLITDWSRDLFDGRPAPETAFGVPLSGALKVASFEGLGEDAARAAGAKLAKSDPDMMWLPSAGLDRHTPLIGLRPLADRNATAGPGGAPADGIHQALYRPLFAVQTAPQAKS